MFTRKSIFRMFIVLLVVLMMNSSGLARPLEAPPLGTDFTYQGKLTDGGIPANGKYDFEFKLYDALSSGSQVGGTVPKGDVIVTAGLFTVQLDFGDVFDGAALYLEIGVRPGSETGAYTALTPRQQLTATPYAIYASKAPWSGLTSVPVGFADGMDDNTTYTAGDGLELDGTQFKGKGTSTQNVVIVAKSGGDFTTITAALDSITTASDTNRFLIYVAPGVYNERVTMKQYVDIEGAGELTTRITQAGSASITTGTVLGANNAELRFLTVKNTGGNNFAAAIYNTTASPYLTHVTASASGGTSNNFGVFNNNSSSPVMTEVTATASGATNTNCGVFNYSSSPTMTDVTASASGGTNNHAVYNESSSSPTMTDVTATAWGGTYNYGVYNESSSSPIMTNVTASGSGGTNNNIGVYNLSSSPSMTNITASAWGGEDSFGVYNLSSSPTINNSIISAQNGDTNRGIYNTASSGAHTVRVNNSQISGSTNSILNDTEFTTRVGASQLSGGAVIAGGGTVSCIGVYDENYASPGYTTCP